MAEIDLPGDSANTGLRLEPGSFRDPVSRVAVGSGEVFRLLSDEGLSDWRLLAATELKAARTTDGSLVGSEEAPIADLGPAASTDLLVAGPPAGVLRHERIPFITYPYEWTFGMLRDAALLQLDLQLEAIDEGMALKDSSPYNVQWRGSKPVFIDVGSFERLREDEPWTGYRQFCMLYLYPLLLQAYKKVDFQPWLRGSIDGISPTECSRLFSRRDRLRRGVLTHVYLLARLERRYQQASGTEVRGELRKARFNPDLIRANVRGLRRLVGRLRWRPGASAWSEYRRTSTYTDRDVAVKTGFVRRAAASRHWGLAWDLGANDGVYARIAAEFADTVLAIDADHATAEALYLSLREEEDSRVLPLVLDLANPSPGLGWRGIERSPLEQRGRPQLILSLAFVHHITIGGNVPIREFVAWLRDLGAEIVIEFPDREDPMVARLLAGKREGSNPDYDRQHFELCLHESFTVIETERLPSDTRTLYRARPRR